MLVTVLLLTYNQKNTIGRALESILEQKVNFDYQIFILDDCSTDGTLDICRFYQAQYPHRIMLFSNVQNLGVEKNLKNGILKVKTPYFAFLEGDDEWCCPDKLARQVEVMEKDPSIMICGHNTLIRHWAKKKEYPLIKMSEKQIYTIDDDFSVHPSSRLYRNTVDISALPVHMVLDSHIYLVYLTRGNLFYIDHIWSIYNLTRQGFWSGKTKGQRKKLKLEYQYQTNRFFDFKYDRKFFKKSLLLKFLKKIFGIPKGWEIFYNIMKCYYALRYPFSKSGANEG